jgi:flagella basal body P-ring formation protein FlgA
MNAARFIAALAACVTLSGAAAAAEVNLYLLSRVELKPGLALGDVARVETDGALAGKLRGITIPEKLFDDGYVDRGELAALVARSTDETVLIYGNSVRLFARPAKIEEPASEVPAYSVRSGEEVSMVLHHRSITLEMPGSVLQDGRVGDLVRVRVKNNKILRGRVVDDKLVELVP